ncbi:MAG: glycerol-3-phosphate acyltransferase [Anaerolineae bacterium]
MTTQAWAVLLGAYLLGSIPSAYLVARFVAGVDIRQVGDGNMGAKNTFESVGWLPGLVVGAADVGKGALAVAMARHFNLPEKVVLWAGACVVLGHDFPLFLRFRDGQGMAAMIGVFGVLFPYEMGVALLVLAVALAITHNWDLSCGIGFGLLPVLLGFSGRPIKQTLYPVLLLPTIGLKKLLAAYRARRAAA